MRKKLKGPELVPNGLERCREKEKAYCAFKTVELRRGGKYCTQVWRRKEREYSGLALCYRLQKDIPTPINRSVEHSTSTVTVPVPAPL
jgi:hypothetical protein